MAEQTSSELDEVGVQDIIELMSQEVAKITREKIVAQAQSKRLITMVGEARDTVLGLQEEVGRLTALVEKAPTRKAPADRAKSTRAKAKSEEVISGELADEGPVQDA